MADKFIDVPANVEDPVILKRFLNELIDKLNGNALVSYPVMYPAGYTGPISLDQATTAGSYTNSILEAAERVDALSGATKNYITGGLTTQVLQNSEDIATVAQQFGIFYADATAAAWYGLTVKTGELISGFTVGGVDTDTTTPGTAGNYFAISADTFTVGRAIADISDPSELAYVQANGLPYGTMYDAVNDEIIPAFMIEWNGTSYDIFFNGKTEFSNYLSPGTTTIDGSKLTTGSIWVGGDVQSTNFTAVGGAGFRLKANAAGTEADPTIYGGTIRGATLIGSLLSVDDVKVKAIDYPNNTGAMYINLAYSVYGTSRPQYAYSDTLLARNSGSGYNKLRMCSNNQFITITAFSATTSGSWTNTCTIEVSYNGGASYSVLRTVSEVASNPVVTYVLNTNGLSNIIIRATGTASSGSLANYGVALLINSQNAV